MFQTVKVFDSKTEGDKLFALEYEHDIYNKYGFPDETTFTIENMFTNPEIILRNLT